MANINNNPGKSSEGKENNSEESTRNIYGGDTSNFGNASQGGVDPATWKEVPEEAARKNEEKAEREEGETSED